MYKVQRNYKDTLFRMIYREREKLLDLYNGVNGTHYSNPEELEVTTLENAIYMNVKNDVSFILDLSLNLYEQQSTVNPNMPLRDLFYVANVLQRLVRDANIYSSALVKIPTPKFVVFYNGTEKQPEHRVLRLSDSFNIKEQEPQLELVVTVLNINPGFNEALLETCRDLREYMLYIAKVREYVSCMSVEEAVSRAVDDCIRDGILAEFLARNKSEAIAVSIFEFNEKLYKEELLQEGFEMGKAEGKTEGFAGSLLLLLESFGEVSEELRTEIMSQGDAEVLKRWLKLAVQEKNVDLFVLKYKE